MFNWIKGFWLGLGATVVLTILAVWLSIGKVERELAVTIKEQLAPDHPWAQVEMDGRDLTLSGTAPSVADSEAAFNTAAANRNVRVVLDRTDQLPIMVPYRFQAALDEGKIALSGYVPNQSVIDNLQEVAGDIAGKENVNNQLALARGEPEGFAGLAESGVRLLGNLAAGSVELDGPRLILNGAAGGLDQYENLLAVGPGGVNEDPRIVVEATPPTVKPYRFSAIHDDDTVFLDGYVPDPELRLRLADALSGTFGEKTIENRLRIAGGAPDRFNDILEHGLELLPALRNGGVKIVDNSFSLQGEAASLDDYQNILLSITELPEGYKLGENTVSPMSVSSSLFSALLSEKGLKLEGFMPGREVRQDVLDRTRTLFPGVEIVNNIKIAEGVPDNLEWAIAAMHVLELLSGLSEGSASITNDTLSMDGVARDRASYDSVLADIGDGLEGGLKFGSANILPPTASPYRWQVEKSPDGIRISGNAPSAEDSVRVATMVMKQMNVAEIENLQTIAQGAPEGFERVQQIATGILAGLETGTLQMFGRAVSITGEAASGEIAESVANTLSNALPEGYKGASRITVRQETQVPEEEEEPQPAENAVACENLINSTINERKILFAVNRATLLAESQTLLSDITAAADQCPAFRIEIRGHTDSDGAAEYNQKLSEGRAAAVLKNLVDAGIPADRLLARGFGENEPVADNETEEGKSRNRRIEFRVIE